jgi:hypothetical protein
MDEGKLRAWWAHQQALDGTLRGRAADQILADTGWARSVGGVGPYLTLFARGGLSRQTVDDAVAELAIHELPSARGCTYVVPGRDYGLALRSGQAFGDSEMNTARKIGVTDKEIDKLSDAIVRALGKGPLEPEELRDATAGASRSLGPEGKKKGPTTTMPIARGRLQSQGMIRRIPTNGRLDQQRYRYARWQPNPLEGETRTPEEAYTELAKLYFRWIAPATLGEFQWFSGLGAKAAKAAAEPLGLVPLATGDPRLLFPQQLDSFRSFTVPREPQYTLVSSIDGLTLLRRDLKGLLAQADIARVESLGGLTDLPSHGIFDRGRLVGLWEYDPATQEIAWTSFVKRNAALVQAVRENEAYVRDQLGDARSFSLDSPKSRVPRIEALRKAAAG